MRRVRCYECGKGYDYDEDGFCPKCGAFNLPQRASSIGADGSVIRREGINERNHKGSFVHAELHEENRERRGTALEQSIRQMVKRPVAETGKKPGPFTLMLLVMGVILLMNILSDLMFVLF